MNNQINQNVKKPPVISIGVNWMVEKKLIFNMV